MDKQSMGVAAITGASSGIGAIYADRLAKRGYDLFLAERDRECMDDIAGKPVAGTQRNIEILAADLRDSNDLAGLEQILRIAERQELLLNLSRARPVGQVCDRPQNTGNIKC